MQALHLHWLTPTQSGQNGRFLLWAETTAADPPNRDRRKKSAQPHPVAASTSELCRLLNEIGWAGKKLPVETLTLWLPTNHFGPVPSPGLLHNWEIDDDLPELLPWTVAGLDLGPEHALSLLAYLQQHELPPVVRLGADGRFWQTTFTLILELLARQLYRPILVQLHDKKKPCFEARWQPLLDGESEARRAAQLAAAMPAICRADAKNPAETLPPRAILDSFLNYLTDTAVRQWATRQEQFLPTGHEPAAAWLRALFATDPTIQASAGQMQHFASSFQAWERALTVAGDRHYRVALRLEAPVQQKRQQQKKGEAAWQLHYLLQARDDASLIVPAAEVWKTKGSILQALDRHFEKPQERLLTGLGYVARFFPPLKRSLQQRSPSSMTLTTNEAYTFAPMCAAAAAGRVWLAGAALVEQAGYAAGYAPEVGQHIAVKGANGRWQRPSVARQSGALPLEAIVGRHRTQPRRIRRAGGSQIPIGADSWPVGAVGPGANRSRHSLLAGARFGGRPFSV